MSWSDMVLGAGDLAQDIPQELRNIELRGIVL
jgi:hypothetical protein